MYGGNLIERIERALNPAHTCVEPWKNLIERIERDIYNRRIFG